VESFAGVYPFGASFLKRKGITPSETQIRELVESAVKDEKTPLAQELKEELAKGPPQEATVTQNENPRPGVVEYPAKTSANMDNTRCSGTGKDSRDTV
jgi:hypothetical protein